MFFSNRACEQGERAGRQLKLLQMEDGLLKEKNRTPSRLFLVIIFIFHIVSACIPTAKKFIVLESQVYRAQRYKVYYAQGYKEEQKRCNEGRSETMKSRLF